MLPGVNSDGIYCERNWNVLSSTWNKEKPVIILGKRELLMPQMSEIFWEVVKDLNVKF